MPVKKQTLTEFIITPDIIGRIIILLRISEIFNNLNKQLMIDITPIAYKNPKIYECPCK